MTNPDLLAAILADPKDDLLRLQYSDWLMENGDERGEFIQIAVAYWSTDCPRICTASRCVCARHNMQVRLQDFLSRRFLSWIDGILGDNWKTVGQSQFGVEFRLSVTEITSRFHLFFRRGFVEHVICSAADWFTHADAITSAHPIERVTLTTAIDAFRRGNTGQEFWFQVIASDVAYSRVMPHITHEQARCNHRGDPLGLLWPKIRFDGPDDSRYSVIHEMARQQAALEEWNRTIEDGYCDTVPFALEDSTPNDDGTHSVRVGMTPDDVRDIASWRRQHGI